MGLAEQPAEIGEHDRELGEHDRRLDEHDRRLLNLMQGRFPLQPRPYAAMAAAAQLTEREALARAQRLLQAGIIRQVTPIYDTRALGYASTLVAAKVDGEDPGRAAEIVNSHPGVSHNYLRNHEWNMWFTIALAPDSTLGLDRTLAILKVLTGAVSMRQLPALRVFKIRVDMDMEGGSGALAGAVAPPAPPAASALQSASAMQSKSALQPASAMQSASAMQPLSAMQPMSAMQPAPAPIEPEPVPYGELDVAVIRATQGGMRVVAEPYADAAARLSMSSGDLIEHMQGMCERGLLRRVAAILSHRRAGFSANGMGVWKVPAPRIMEIGLQMASFRGVSHCYERPTYEDWPYSIFTMAHGRSRAECEAILEAIARQTGIEDRAVLYSSTEFKKIRLQYFTDDLPRWEHKHAVAPARVGAGGSTEAFSVVSRMAKGRPGA